MAHASWAYRRPHGPQNGDGKKNQEAQELLAEHMVAQPAEPHGRVSGSARPRLDHPRNEPESIRGGQREHCTEQSQLREKNLPVQSRKQAGDRSDQEPAY